MQLTGSANTDGAAKATGATSALLPLPSRERVRAHPDALAHGGEGNGAEDASRCCGFRPSDIDSPRLGGYPRAMVSSLGALTALSTSPSSILA